MGFSTHRGWGREVEWGEIHFKRLEMHPQIYIYLNFN
jgi:hypothetical protein